MPPFAEMPAAGLWTFGSFFLKSPQRGGSILLPRLKLFPPTSWLQAQPSGLWAALKLLCVLGCMGRDRGSLPAKSQPWSHGWDVSEISKSLEDGVGGRPVGSRESENIIPAPSVSLHLSWKNASKNGEHSSAENGLIAKLQSPPLLQHGHPWGKITTPPPPGYNPSLVTPLTKP